MNETQRESCLGCQGVPVTCGLGEKSQHAEGERGFYMEIGEHSKV